MDKDEFGHGDLVDRLGRLGRQPVPQHIARRHTATIQGVLPARPWRRPALAMAAALTVAVGGGAVWAAAGSRSGDGGSVALEQPPGVPSGGAPERPEPPADTPASPVDRSPDDPCTGAPPWAATGSDGTPAERVAWQLARAAAGCPIGGSDTDRTIGAPTPPGNPGLGNPGLSDPGPGDPGPGDPGPGNPGLGNDNGAGNAGTVNPGNGAAEPPADPPASPAPGTPPTNGNPGLGNDNGAGNAGTVNPVHDDGVPPGNPAPGTPPATPKGDGTPAGGRADG